MAFNSNVVLSGLTKYADQLANDIMRTPIALSVSRNYVRVQEGVKYNAPLNLLSSVMVWQDSACGTILANGGTGSTTLTQASVIVDPIMIEETICLVGANSLEQYWTGVEMSLGSYYDTLTPDVFWKAFTANHLEQITFGVGKGMWLGSKTGATFSTDPNMLKTTGFLKLIDSTYSASIIPVGATTSTYPVTYGSTASGALTVANGYDVVQAMNLLVPDSIAEKEDLYAYMSVANYKMYTASLITKFQNAVYQNGPKELNGRRVFMIDHPGSMIHVVGLPELSGSNRIILTNKENLTLGTDLQSDFETFSIKYESLINAVVFRALWKQGVQIAFPQNVVMYLG